MGRFKHTVAAAALVAVATVAVTVAGSLATMLKTNRWAWAAAGALLLASGAIAAYRAWSSREPAKRADVEDAFAALAETIKRRLDEAVNHRGLRVDQLIDVPWETRPYQGETKTTRAVRDAGGIEALAEVVLCRNARILVVGPAGAGKSSLARRIALSCTRSTANGDRVPVVLAASTWTVGEPVRRWIENQLLLLHPGVRRRTDSGATIAMHLITARRLLLVIDGLDELPDDPREWFCEALRDAMLEELPLIISCRTDPDVDPVATLPLMPVDTVVTMQRVRRASALATLRKSASERQLDSWARVDAAVRKDPNGGLARTLSRPLMVAMAAEIYHRGAPERDPEELTTVADPGDHILGTWIPTVLRRQRNVSNETSPRREQKTRRWLTFLAKHLDRRGTYDLRWWELRTALSARASLVSVAIAVAAVVGVAAGPSIGPARAIGLGACVGALVLLEFDAVRPPGQPQQVVPVRSGRLHRWLRVHWRRVRPGVVKRFTTGFTGACALIWGLGALLWGVSLADPGFVHQALSGGGVMPDLTGFDPVALMIAASLLLGVFVGGLVAMAPVDQDVASLREVVLDGRPDGFPGTHQDVEFDQAADFRHTLSQDRRWSLLRLAVGAVVTVPLLQAGVTGGAAQAFPLLHRVDEHLGWWIVLLAVIAVVVQVFLHAEWPWFVAARIPLALGGRIPVRLTAFLDEMDAVDILRREGDVYRFRHTELRDWLLKEAAKQRYETLGDDRQRLLRRLAVHPGPDVTADLAAYIDNITSFEARRLLDEFCSARLMTRAGDRYEWRSGCHPAIVEAARDAVDPPGVREQVAGAVKAYYRQFLSSGYDTPMSLPGPAWRRLRTDRRTVVASVRQAVRDGDLEYAAETVLVVAPYLVQWGHEAEGQDLIEAVLALPVPPCTAIRLRYQLLSVGTVEPADLLDQARRLGDRTQEVVALCAVAYAANDPNTAVSAISLAEQVDRPTVLLTALLDAGHLSMATDPAGAEHFFARAERIARKWDRRYLEASALEGMGMCLLAQRRPNAAATSLRAAKRSYEATGAFLMATETALRLAGGYFRYNKLRAAHVVLWTAIRLSRAIGSEYHLARSYLLQGETFLLEKDYGTAARLSHWAHGLFVRCDAKLDAPLALILSGTSLMDVGRALSERKIDGDWAVTEGRKRLEAARLAFADLGEPAGEARALLELGRRATTDGDARLWLTKAVTIYESLDEDDHGRFLEQARSLLARRTTPAVRQRT
ncbi:NACHT domain-containing protein [Amycolatopsis sp. NPDC004747]